MGTFSVIIISPEEVLYKGPAREISIPSVQGARTILSRHAPFLAALKKGTIKITAGSSEKEFEVENGFIEVSRKPAREAGKEAGFVNIFVRHGGNA